MARLTPKEVHEHRLESVRKWRRSHPRHAKYLKKQLNAKANYGLSKEEFDLVADRLNNGPCEVWGRTDSGVKNRGFHIDHDHLTGKFRGILYHWCNLAIGNAKDDPERLSALAKYLQDRMGK